MGDIDVNFNGVLDVAVSLDETADVAVLFNPAVDIAVNIPSDIVETFTPTDVANLALWLKSDIGVTGDPVSLWEDQSAQGNDASQGIGANQPDFLANQINGLPSIKGDGGNDILNLGSNITAADFAVFMVMGGSAGPNYMLGHASNLYFRYTGTSLIWRNSTTHSFNHSNVPLTAGYFLHHITRRTNSVKSYRDNIESLTGTVTNAVQLTLSKIFSFGTSFGFGAIAELIIYNGTVSPTDESSLVSYLNTRYAL